MDYGGDFGFSDSPMPWTSEGGSDPTGGFGSTPDWNDPGLLPNLGDSSGGGSAGGGFDWSSLLGFLNSPAGAGLMGALGPLLGMAGGLASGGKTGTQQQTGTSASTQTGSQTGTSQTNVSGSQTGTQTGTATPQWGFPEQQQMFQGAQGANAFMQPAANQLWQQGTGALGKLGSDQGPLQQQQQGLLQQLGQQAGGLGTNPLYGGGQGGAGGSDTLSIIKGMQPANLPAPGQMMQTNQLEGYMKNLLSGNMQVPAELKNLVQKSFDPMVSGIADQAIQNARSRGFAGGGSLLGGAASPLAGQALAQVPGMEAQALLNAMLTQIPGAASQMLGAEAGAQGANASMQNANANLAGIQNQFNLGLGSLSNQARQTEINAALADAQRMLAGNTVAQGMSTPANFQASLLPLMMNPQQQQFGNQSQLFGQFPFGQQTAGQTAQQNLTQSQGQTSGTQTGTQSGTTTGTGSQSVPWQQLLGQGMQGALGGFGQGMGAAQNQQFMQALLPFILSQYMK